MKNNLEKMHNKNPITCKCGKYSGKSNQGQKCNRCKTRVTFKMDHYANSIFRQM